LRTKGRLEAASTRPTPEQIVPYREALVMNEYSLGPKQAKNLGTARIRVAHWAILDGEKQKLPKRLGGRRVPLVLEPWDHHPRLDGVYLSDTLEIDPDALVYVDISR
jgi:hypothetical protein